MGYLAAVPEAKKVQEKAPHECLLRFDSGNSITFEDARHHMLALGTTGSGKTASVVLPALFRLIEAGHCGVIIDIKGNLRGQARAFARQCGRSADLVEFGSSPSATPLNLLCGMDMSAVRNLLRTLTMGHFQSASHSKDWHMKGVHQGGDCVQLLRYLTELDTAFEPTLCMIASMVNDYALSAGLFGLFKKALFNKNNVEQRMFVQQIASNEFHIFNYDAERTAKRSSSYLEQITWNLQGIRMALTDFLEAPGIARGFASQGAAGVDVRGLLEQNKIVLLRFGPDTGPVGSLLARMILREYYKAVYAIGLTMPEGVYSFACLDEFQDFADLGSGRFSDTNFIAQAREFHAIFLASTQSMAALANRGNSFAAVSAFVSNCNARVLFYSDDPFTQSMAAQYDSGIRLNGLRSGEAFVLQYDTEQRKHFFGVETLQQAYAVARDILRQAAYSGDKDSGVTAEAETVPPLFELLEQAEARHNAAVEEKKRADTSELKEDESASRKTGLHSVEKESSFPGEGESPVAESPSSDTPDDLGERMLKLIHSTEGYEGALRLRKSFSQYFPANGQVCMAIPAGWVSYVEKAFQAFMKSGLTLTIGVMVEKGGALVVFAAEPNWKPMWVADYRHTGERLMNALLRGTRELCPLCGGSAAKPQPKDGWGVDEKVGFSICVGCLGKYGMLPMDEGSLA